MKMKTLRVGPLLTNCYVVAGETGCVVVDPGAECEKITAAIGECGLPLCGILITHGHDDHIGALTELCTAYPVPVYVSEKAVTDGGYETVRLSDGDVFRAGGMEFRVMAVPGHTADSVSYFTGQVMFSGDTLFRGTIGRTDLGGSMEDMLASIEKIKTINDPDILVLPGHGFRTTLGRELKENPYYI